MTSILHDGSTDWMNTGVGNVPTAVSLSMAIWYYPTTVDAAEELIRIEDASDANHFFSLRHAGNIALDPVRAVARSGVAGAAVAESTTGVTVNTWNHACGVFASTTGRTIYLNGGSSATDVNSRTPTGLDRVSIGANAAGGPTQFFTGRLAWAAIWDTSLSAGEVLALAQGMPPWRMRPENVITWPLTGLFLSGLEPNWQYSTNHLTINGTPVIADGPPIGSYRTLRRGTFPFADSSFVPYPNPRYSMHAGHQPLGGGII